MIIATGSGGKKLSQTPEVKKLQYYFHWLYKQ